MILHSYLRHAYLCPATKWTGWVKCPQRPGIAFTEVFIRGHGVCRIYRVQVVLGKRSEKQSRQLYFVVEEHAQECLQHVENDQEAASKVSDLINSRYDKYRREQQLLIEAAVEQQQQQQQQCSPVSQRSPAYSLVPARPSPPTSVADVTAGMPALRLGASATLARLGPDVVAAALGLRVRLLEEAADTQGHGLQQATGAAHRRHSGAFAVGLVAAPQRPQQQQQHGSSSAVQHRASGASTVAPEPLPSGLAAGSERFSSLGQGFSPSHCAPAATSVVHTPPAAAGVSFPVGWQGGMGAAGPQERHQMPLCFLSTPPGAASGLQQVDLAAMAAGAAGGVLQGLPSAQQHGSQGAAAAAVCGGLGRGQAPGGGALPLYALAPSSAAPNLGQLQQQVAFNTPVQQRPTPALPTWMTSPGAGATGSMPSSSHVQGISPACLSPATTPWLGGPPAAVSSSAPELQPHGMAAAGSAQDVEMLAAPLVGAGGDTGGMGQPGLGAIAAAAVEGGGLRRLLEEAGQRHGEPGPGGAPWDAEQQQQRYACTIPVQQRVAGAAVHAVQEAGAAQAAGDSGPSRSWAWPGGMVPAGGCGEEPGMLAASALRAAGGMGPASGHARGGEMLPPSALGAGGSNTAAQQQGLGVMTAAAEGALRRQLEEAYSTQKQGLQQVAAAASEPRCVGLATAGAGIAPLPAPAAPELEQQQLRPKATADGVSVPRSSTSVHMPEGYTLKLLKQGSGRVGEGGCAKLRSNNCKWVPTTSSSRGHPGQQQQQEEEEEEEVWEEIEKLSRRKPPRQWQEGELPTRVVVKHIKCGAFPQHELKGLKGAGFEHVLERRVPGMVNCYALRCRSVGGRITDMYYVMDYLSDAARDLSHLVNSDCLTGLLDDAGDDGWVFSGFTYRDSQSGEIKQVMWRKQGLPWSVVLLLLVHVLKLVCRWHAVGVAHCDLKPANLLLDATRLIPLVRAQLAAGSSSSGGQRPGVRARAATLDVELYQQLHDELELIGADKDSLCVYNGENGQMEGCGLLNSGTREYQSPQVWAKRSASDGGVAAAMQEAAKWESVMFAVGRFFTQISLRCKEECYGLELTDATEEEAAAEEAAEEAAAAKEVAVEAFVSKRLRLFLAVGMPIELAMFGARLLHPNPAKRPKVWELYNLPIMDRRFFTDEYYRMVLQKERNANTSYVSFKAEYADCRKPVARPYQGFRCAAPAAAAAEAAGGAASAVCSNKRAADAAAGDVKGASSRQRVQ